MVFGFGFNKAKVLASAERNVKQGKLTNAIADYERIAHEDPKDLNILNTLGDLYARAGKIEQASACFKRVGDHYAGEGFTVKAIAMYKKLTKHNPGDSNALIKLAEFYTQQGLYNEARLQYTAVADHFLTHNEPESAALVLQKTMEFDPNNPQLQGRLADVFLKLGKPSEARDLLFRLAQNLRIRGSLDACDQALDRTLAIDPSFTQAILFRGQVKLELDDAQGAVRCLEALPDIDSRGEALRFLFRAHLKLGNRAEAEPLARKLLKVHNDSSSIFAFCQFLANLGEYEATLAIYTEYSDCLLAADTEAVLGALQSMVSRVRNNAPALESLRFLFERAGGSSSQAEVTELLAHVYVQEGSLEKARDLYQQLAELEPDNPLHAQNFRQIATRLGALPDGEHSSESASASEGLLEQLEDQAPAIEQGYPTLLRNAIHEALTDSELFASYNLPARAVEPLEAILPQAPDDVEINQRLASLYARLERDEDAACRCEVLAKAYDKAGDGDQRQRYAELAAQYRQRAGIPGDKRDNLPHCETAERPAESAGQEAEPTPELDVEEQNVAELLPEPAAMEEEAPAIGASSISDIAAESGQVQAAMDSPAVTPAAFTPVAADAGSPQAAEFETGAQENPAPECVADAAVPREDTQTEAEPEFLAHEIDLSEEWERMAAATEPVPSDTDFAAKAPDRDHSEAGPLPVSVSAPALDTFPSNGAGDVSAVPESQATHELAGDHTSPALNDTPNPAMDAELGDVIEEARFYISQQMWEEARATTARAEQMAPSAPVIKELWAQIPASVQAAAVDVIPAPAPEADAVDPGTQAPESQSLESADGVQSPVQEFTIAPPVEFLPEHREPSEQAPGDSLELLDTTHLGLGAPDQASPAAFTASDSPVDISYPEELVSVSEPAEAQDNRNGAEAHDLEPDLLSNLELPAYQPAALAAAGSVAPGAYAPDGDPLGDIALSLETRLSDVGAAAPDACTVAANAAPPPVTLTGFANEAAAAAQPDFALSELFAEFKQDMEADPGEEDDPETHYNLGMAFKEMGLLDEAIGELQKVCMAIDHGAAFPNVVQAYTWLAHCFVEKGIPEAGAGWYERALGLQALGKEQTLAIRYELGCAQQAAGNLVAARQHFMHVLSLNIDYRDVTERIKALKS